MFRERPGALQDGSIVIELRRSDLKKFGWIFTVVFAQHRLGIERIHLRRTTIHVQKDDALGALRIVQLRLSFGIGLGLLREQGMQCNRSKTAGSSLEPLAARHRKSFHRKVVRHRGPKIARVVLFDSSRHAPIVAMLVEESSHRASIVPRTEWIARLHAD